MKPYILPLLMLFWVPFSPAVLASPYGSAEIASDGQGASSEEKCTEISLIEKRKNDRWNEFFDQGGTQWCGAYSAADALSYNSGRPISPLFVGALYVQNFSKKPGEQEPSQFDFKLAAGTTTCDAVANIFISGYCDVASIEGKGIKTSDIIQLAYLYGWLEDFRVKNPSGYTSRSEILAKALSSVAEYSPEDRQRYFKFLSNKAIPDGIKNANDFFASFFSSQCGKPSHLRVLPSCSYVVKGGAENFLGGAIDRQLQKGVMPVLTFNSRRIYSDEVYNVPELSPHAVTINGRRWNQEKHRCEYRIRNSNRIPKCSGFSSLVSCVENELSRGFVWIDQAAFESDSWTNIALVGAERHRMKIKLPEAPKPAEAKKDSGGFSKGTMVD